MQELICACCGATFYRRNKIACCSKACAGKMRAPAQRTGVTLQCTTCGKPFYAQACRRGTAEFCSVKCAYVPRATALHAAANAANTGRRPANFGKVLIECVKCGKRFGVVRSAVGRARFCSKACTNAMNRTGKVGKYRRVRRLGKEFLEHRWIMQQHLGRPLRPTEHIHHLNGKKADNRIENLTIIAPGQHSRHHIRERVAKLPFAKIVGPA